MPKKEKRSASAVWPQTWRAQEEMLSRIGTRLRTLRATGRLDDAVEMLQMALNEDPSSRQVRLWLAETFLAKGLAADAALLLESISEGPKDEAYLLLKGVIAYAVGEPSEALSALDEALRLRPGSAQAYLDLAYLRYSMSPANNRHEAETYYRHAVRLGAARDAQFEKRLGMAGGMGE